MAGQGPLIYWVALHRKHHQSSDREGDPHSPVPRAGGWSARLASLWHAHVGWVLHHDVPAPQRYARDACADRLQVFVSRTYALWVALGLLLPALIGGCVLRSWEGALGGLLWGGLGRLFLVNNLIWSVNSVGHAFGTRPHDTGDQSRNNALLALVSFGEGLHNNHHASPRSARFAASRGHLLLDLGYVFLSILASIGAARALEQRGAGQR
jgi:stearoyl-CoA desaturase (delta-9 desaturase)